jgi:hypothetical protein
MRGRLLLLGRDDAGPYPKCIGDRRRRGRKARAPSSPRLGGTAPRLRGSHLLVDGSYAGRRRESVTTESFLTVNVTIAFFLTFVLINVKVEIDHTTEEVTRNPTDPQASSHHGAATSKCRFGAGKANSGAQI